VQYQSPLVLRHARAAVCEKLQDEARSGFATRTHSLAIGAAAEQLYAELFFCRLLPIKSSRRRLIGLWASQEDRSAGLAGRKFFARQRLLGGHKCLSGIPLQKFVRKFIFLINISLWDSPFLY
jgi:hypothetical protein